MNHLHPTRKEPPLPSSMGREDMKKILTAKLEHERFLEKLGIVADEGGLLDEPFLGPSPLAGRTHPQIGPSDNAGTQTNGLSGPIDGIPWRKKDPKTSPVIERSHLYETFDKISAEPPETPPVESVTKIGSRASTKRIKPRKHHLFADIREHRHSRHNSPYSLVQPKVDSGLGSVRTQPQPIPDQPLALTIGPKFAKNLAAPPQESGAAARRAAKIATISARLHNGGSSTTRSRTQQPPESVNQWAQNLPLVSHNAPESRINNEKTTTRVGFPHPSIPKDALLIQAQQQKYIKASSSGSTAKTNPYYTGERDQIQIIHARAMANLSPSLGTNMPFFTAIQRARDFNNGLNSSGGGPSGGSGTTPPGVLAAQTNNYNSLLSAGNMMTTASEFEQGGSRTRRLRPSQLMPRHVPGPKYDNIYIGPYSGSESDKDNEENMDRRVKSRKR